MNEKKARYRQPTEDEQHVLDHLHVQLVGPEQLAEFDQWMVKDHYLKSSAVVGEHLRYRATYRGQWLALATWSAPALHLKARDQFIHWTEEQRRQRLALIANNSRLLILPDCHYPNLASRFMKAMLQRLSQDWQAAWGHPVGLVETFVDPQLYQGTIYRVSGWSHLGKTAGWKRNAEDFYQKHERPKQVWVKELVKKACVKMRAPQLPPDWAVVEKPMAPRCTAKATEIRSLMEQLAAVPEFRRKEALGYPLAGMLALMAMAMFSGVARGPEDLADYAATLSQGQLRALKFRRWPRTDRMRCPKKSTFERVLAGVQARVLEQVLLLWQEQVLGPGQDKLVIVDGKEIRHAGVEIVNAVDGQGRWLGASVVAAGTNEIPTARAQLSKLNIAGKIVIADALHTNEQTARQILFEGGGDYLLTVKDNQPELVKTLESLLQKQAFSPSPYAADACLHAGTQSGAAGDPRVGLSGDQPGASELSGHALDRPPETAGPAPGQADHQNHLSDQQSALGGT